ncbi:MAG: tRNA epoxyqueuosine(34) reductase QueG [Gammaproteobacteria bacterium]|nr:tRNA epoxyqueuosine(34) reductase QueG [Gammaproteobacteria bacterium]
MNRDPQAQNSPETLARLAREQALALGFDAVGFTSRPLADDEQKLAQWLAEGRHGDMEWMARHGHKRSRPAELVEGTVSVISVRLDYRPDEHNDPVELLDHPSKAYVSRYALGRDYHKLLRNRLQKLATELEALIGPFGYRAFVDSAPVMEKPLARDAGLGWIGKHTNLLQEKTGSWFFLGELYTDLPLPQSEAATDHCGSCTRCIEVCPTRAITAPYQLDARRCISYLTIENKGAIPEEFRKPMGNRIYGCDDCQLFCPWNKFSQVSKEADFLPRQSLDDIPLTDLFGWSESEFEEKLAGSAIRRIGFEAWLRNIAVALGNARTSDAVIDALQARRDHPSELVREHVAWALAQHGA